MWKEAETYLKKDKYIAPLIKKWGSCDIEKQSKSEYFTDLVEAITSQQLSGAAAETIFGRVKKLCNGNLTGLLLVGISGDHWKILSYLESTESGLRGIPFWRISKCKCGPVVWPVSPTFPTSSLVVTFSPVVTSILLMWA